MLSIVLIQCGDFWFVDVSSKNICATTASISLQRRQNIIFEATAVFREHITDEQVSPNIGNEAFFPDSRFASGI